MTLNELLDTAKTKGAYHSDRQLALAVSANPGNVFTYRKHRAFPSDQTMIRLCEIAEIDPVEGLIWLNVWRTEGEAQTTYKGILERMKASAAAIVACGALITGIPMKAEASTVNLSDGHTHNLHYGKYRRRKSAGNLYALFEYIFRNPGVAL